MSKCCSTLKEFVELALRLCGGAPQANQDRFFRDDWATRDLVLQGAG